MGHMKSLYLLLVSLGLAISTISDSTIKEETLDTTSVQLLPEDGVPSSLTKRTQRFGFIGPLQVRSANVHNIHSHTIT